MLGNPIVLVDPDGRTVKPAKSLKGSKLKVFKQLKSSNKTYKRLLTRYLSENQGENLHYRVGNEKRLSENDVSYAHTSSGTDAFKAKSKARGYQALYSGTVTTDLVRENTTNFSDVGIAAVLIHEAVHANILAEAPFDAVNGSDHHVPFDNQIFGSTLEGLQEFSSTNGLEYSNRDLKLLAANGLWGTEAVNEAFGLDPNSETYDSDLRKLQEESKSLFKKDK